MKQRKEITWDIIFHELSLWLQYWQEVKDKDKLEPWRLLDYKKLIATTLFSMIIPLYNHQQMLVDVFFLVSSWHHHHAHEHSCLSGEHQHWTSASCFHTLYHSLTPTGDCLNVLRQWKKWQGWKMYFYLLTSVMWIISSTSGLMMLCSSVLVCKWKIQEVCSYDEDAFGCCFYSNLYGKDFPQSLFMQQLGLHAWTSVRAEERFMPAFPLVQSPCGQRQKRSNAMFSSLAPFVGLGGGKNLS